MSYFVMMWNQTDDLVPLLRDDGVTVVLFNTVDQAMEMARNTLLAAEFGYTIFSTDLPETWECPPRR